MSRRNTQARENKVELAKMIFISFFMYEVIRLAIKFTSPALKTIFEDATIFIKKIKGIIFCKEERTQRISHVKNFNR